MKVLNFIISFLLLSSVAFCQKQTDSLYIKIYYRWPDKHLQEIQHGNITIPKNGREAKELYFKCYYNQTTGKFYANAILSSSGDDKMQTFFKHTFGYTLFIFRRAFNYGNLSRNFYEVVQAKSTVEDRYNGSNLGSNVIVLSRNLYNQDKILINDFSSRIIIDASAKRSGLYTLDELKAFTDKCQFLR